MIFGVNISRNGNPTETTFARSIDELVVLVTNVDEYMKLNPWKNPGVVKFQETTMILALPEGDDKIDRMPTSEELLVTDDASKIPLDIIADLARSMLDLILRDDGIIVCSGKSGNLVHIRCKPMYVKLPIEQSKLPSETDETYFVAEHSDMKEVDVSKNKIPMKKFSLMESDDADMLKALMEDGWYTFPDDSRLDIQLANAEKSGKYRYISYVLSAMTSVCEDKYCHVVYTLKTGRILKIEYLDNHRDAKESFEEYEDTDCAGELQLQLMSREVVNGKTCNVDFEDEIDKIISEGTRHILMDLSTGNEIMEKIVLKQDINYVPEDKAEICYEY